MLGRRGRKYDSRSLCGRRGNGIKEREARPDRARWGVPNLGQIWVSLSGRACVPTRARAQNNHTHTRGREAIKRDLWSEEEEIRKIDEPNLAIPCFLFFFLNWTVPT